MGAVAGADEVGETASKVGETPSQALEQTSRTPEQATEPASEQTPPAPGFGERGRMRRRARFLRKARELAYRDLGGLVFDLHRFGQRNDPLVLAKLAALRHVDTELRELEGALGERRPVTVLREAGIAACPRCAAIHGSDDNFCPGCGLAFDAKADRPISTGPIAQPAQIQPPASQQPIPQQPMSQQPSLPAQIAPAAPAVSEPAAVTPSTPAPLSAKPVPPRVEQASPVRSSPPPVAKPAIPSAPLQRHEPERPEEDEPTQVLRPPARGT
jgi:hypothetical protein